MQALLSTGYSDFESKCFYLCMQNYRLMSMINQNQEQKWTVKVIAPLVGFTSDKNFLDFGDFTIRKIREDIIDSPGLGGDNPTSI